MDKVFSIDQLRLVCATICSTLAAYFTPTKGFLFALVIMFGFNIWAGVRADGWRMRSDYSDGDPDKSKLVSNQQISLDFRKLIDVKRLVA